MSVDFIHFWDQNRNKKLDELTRFDEDELVDKVISKVESVKSNTYSLKVNTVKISKNKLEIKVTIE